MGQLLRFYNAAPGRAEGLPSSVKVDGNFGRYICGSEPKVIDTGPGSGSRKRYTGGGTLLMGYHTRIVSTIQSFQAGGFSGVNEQLCKLSAAVS
jgi:hypothetical protein